MMLYKSPFLKLVGIMYTHALYIHVEAILVYMHAYITSRLQVIYVHVHVVKVRIGGTCYNIQQDV